MGYGKAFWKRMQKRIRKDSDRQGLTDRRADTNTNTDSRGNWEQGGENNEYRTPPDLDCDNTRFTAGNAAHPNGAEEPLQPNNNDNKTKVRRSRNLDVPDTLQRTGDIRASPFKINK